MFRNNPKAGPAPNTPLNILIMASFVWGFIALITAIDPAYSFNELALKMSRQYLLYVLAYSLTCMIVTDIEKVKHMLLPVAVAACIMSVYACLQFFESPVFLQNRVTGFTGAFYRLAVFLVLAIPLITALAYVMPPRIRWALLMIMPFAGAALFFTSVRSAWIALCIEASILVFILFRKYRKAFISGMLAVVIVFIVAAYHSEYKHLIVHGSEQPRLKAFDLSLHIVRAYPLTGIGYGKQTFSKYYPDVNEVKHAHNIFVNTAVELGVTGLVILSVMFVIIAKDFMRAIKRETACDRKILLSGLCAALAGFLTLNLFDYMYHGWPGQMFWMLIGMGYALMSPAAESKN